MPSDRALARRHLDARFDTLRVAAQTPRPHRGWVRAIRDALGMSAADLAVRLGVAQQAVSELERSEMNGTVRLDTLRRAADALDCDLVYVLVPRRSLNDIVATQAERKATAQIAPIAHHSRLENQAVDDGDLNALIVERARQLIDRRGLWTASTDPE
ncbi:MAG: mobile mystery protein A [Acidimicrobiia bacterium]